MPNGCSRYLHVLEVREIGQASRNGTRERVSTEVPAGMSIKQAIISITECQVRIAMCRQSTLKDNCMASQVHQQIQTHLRRDVVHETGSLEANTTMHLDVPLKCAFLAAKMGVK